MFWPHHTELARHTIDRPLGRRRVDRRNRKTGLQVRCELNAYAKGIKVSDAEMGALNIKGDAFHPEWNHTISPRSPQTIHMTHLFFGVT
jgi:hypothetical protein